MDCPESPRFSGSTTWSTVFSVIFSISEILFVSPAVDCRLKVVIASLDLYVGADILMVRLLSPLAIDAIGVACFRASISRMKSIFDKFATR